MEALFFFSPSQEETFHLFTSPAPPPPPPCQPVERSHTWQCQETGIISPPPGMPPSCREEGIPSRTGWGNGSEPCGGAARASPAPRSISRGAANAITGTAEPSSRVIWLHGAGGAVRGCSGEMLEGGGCEVRVQGRGRNNEGFREGGCQGSQL